MTCKSCGSFRHLVAECPDSWENLSKVNITEAEPEEELADLLLDTIKKMSANLEWRHGTVQYLTVHAVALSVEKLGYKVNLAR